MKEKISKAIKQFDQGDLFRCGISLFDTLGYNTTRQNKLDDNTFRGFKDIFLDGTQKFIEQNALVNDWRKIELLFQLTSEEMALQDSLFRPTVERDQPASFLFMAVELDKSGYSRTALAQISREINKCFPMDVFLLFRYGKYLTLSLIERRPNRKILDKDVMEKVIHVFNISIEKPHAAHIQILTTFSMDSIRLELPKKRIDGFKDLKSGWRKVLSTQVLNRQFYLDYQQLSRELIHQIYPDQQKEKIKAHHAILNLLNRIMFIYFVQKKGWIMNNENFMIHFWNDYLRSGQKNQFHQHWLNGVFFKAFNGIAYRSPELFRNLPQPWYSGILSFPYLNGGMFTFNKELDDFLLPDDSFIDIFNFFEGYIFTISEDTPYDVNLEINPQLLGLMYEGMINATDLDDVEAEHGIVYTERPEINFMTRRSFVEVLDKKLGGRKSREFLYTFVFEPHEQKVNSLKKYMIQADELKNAIANITVCDPSCGSGSMLLGVIHLQIELLRAIADYSGTPMNHREEFNLKKQLISETIYGVDIKEWAVRIAELRLWLYMIADAEFSEEELTAQPLLPNLDFKLRCGNSLLQKFGTLDFNVEDLLKDRKKTSGAARKLSNYIRKKKAYIVNQEQSESTFEELKAEEFRVFNEFIDEIIFVNQQKIKNRLAEGQKQQLELDILNTGMQAQFNLYEDEIAALQKEIEELRKLREFLKKENRLPFSYDIDFMEVFLTPEDPGFDLIIGNPPYVRQEQILPPEDGEYLEYLLKPENKEEKARVNKTYKERLNEKIYKTYPFLATTVRTEIEGKPKTIPVYGSKAPGRSDLYCYFQLLCPSYLNSKGTFCFIISNSWLDVDFGSFVQHFLLKHTRIYGVYDCNVRSFEAAVNTVIYLHSALINHDRNKPKSFFQTLKPSDHTVRFIMNKIGYEETAYAPILSEQEHCRENTFRDFYRVIPLTQRELYEAGYNEETKSYDGDKWGGKYLRAPEIYYKILEKGSFSPLSKFGNVSSVSWSRMGLNGEIIKKYGEKIETSYRTEAVLKSPKDISKITIRLEDTKNVLIHHPNINGKIVYSDLLWVDLRNDKHVCHFCKERIAYAHNFHGINSKTCKSLDLCLYLNSSVSCFFVEVLGRHNLGEGAIRILANDLYKFFPVFLTQFSFDEEFSFLNRIQNSIFKEIGISASFPIRDQFPNPLPDRKALDDVIFDEIGLTPEERNEVYWSLAELVKQRLDKAGSR